MLSFNIIDMGNYKFRCVLGEESYFDFSVAQLELFGYNNYFSYLSDSVGSSVFSVKEDRMVGEVVSAKYLNLEDEVWLLTRNGIRGEFFSKKLGE